MTRLSQLLCLPVLLVLSLPAFAAKVDFDRDIRPILSDNCFACHGPDTAKRKAGLRLDVRQTAFLPLKDGDGFAIVPNNLAKSALYERITSTEEEELMPPPKSGKKLTAHQVDLIKQWIEQGADYPEHWAWVPPVRPAIPTVKDSTWVKNPIDNFILARLEQEGLSPSPEADKISLLRRVTFDLTGLPPTLSQIDAFLSDDSANAYEKVVDRLLASPAYGERMAVQWLDLARYGDSNGYHIDNNRDIWKWREWVINAFNQNKPFDQFTIEQLAGDMLPNATLEQRIATGFNRNNMVNFEGGADPDEYLTKYIGDRVTTTSTVFLGITMQCTECHDHKYDPFTQKEYYQLYAFFHNVPERGLDGSQSNPVPSIPVPSPEQTAKLAEYKQQIASLDMKMKAPMPAMDDAQTKWELATSEEIKRAEAAWAVLRPADFSSKNGAILSRLNDQSLLASGANPPTDVYELTTTATSPVNAIRLEALLHKSIPGRGVGRSENNNFVLTGFEVEAAPSSAPTAFVPVQIAGAFADYSQPNFPISNAIDKNPATGWAVDGNTKKENRLAVFVPSTPINNPGGTLLRIRLRFESQFAQHTIGRFRLSTSSDPSAAGSLLPPVLSEWKSVGPFTAPDGKTSFDEAFPPEQGVDLQAKYNNKLSWKSRPEWKDSTIQIIGEAPNSAIYLYRTIDSPASRSLALSLGSDDGIKVWLNGKLVHANNAARGTAPDQDKVTVTLKPGTNKLLIKISNQGGGTGFYFASTPEGSGRPAKIDSALAKVPTKRTDAEKNEIRQYYRENFSADYKKLTEEVALLKKAEAELNKSIPQTMVMEEMAKPRDTFILIRGDFRNKGEKVHAAVPATLFAPTTRPSERSHRTIWPTSQPSNRLELAKWLVNPSNPLVSRVTVNRYWLLYFGTGIVKTTEDFGSQGDPPSHPQLLDYLATRFIDSKWDIKAMQRLIVTSATYRQSARVTPELYGKDPYNRLLARGPRSRLPAEMIRDSALAVSGLIDRRIGGPSIFPYQPPKLWDEIAFGGNFSSQVYVQSHGADLYRRGMYIYAKRSMPNPSLSTLDAPNREVCTVQRPVTNTPLQALLLLNDPIYVEAARALAQHTLQQGGLDDSARLTYAFRLCTSRLPSQRELSILERSLSRAREKFSADKDAANKLIAVGESARPKELDPQKLACWTSVCNVLLNMDEALNH